MRGEVQLPLFYTRGALADLGNVTPHVMTSLLRECGGHRVRAGRKVLIPTAELAKKVPLLLQTLQVVESLRRRCEQGKSRS